jgi:hypothetical protein
LREGMADAAAGERRVGEIREGHEESVATGEGHEFDDDELEASLMEL